MKKQTRDTKQQDAETGDSLRAIAPSNLQTAEATPPQPQAPTLPDPAKPISEQEPVLLLAMCLFGEARGQSDLVQRAVAQVILNRANHPRTIFGSRKGAGFEENLRSVILQPQQFSSLNPYDPNYAALLHPLEEEPPQVWKRCLLCAQKALESRDHSDTLTANSDHYFDDSIQPPSWADPTKQTVKVGPLNFYRLYLPSPQGEPAGSRQEAASGLSSGSRLRAKVSAAKPELSATAGGGDTLARGLHGPRPNTSLPSPKSPSVRDSGPGPYPRYDRRGGLSILMLLVLTLLLSACSDFERTAFQVLAVTQAEYQTTQDHVADAAVRGLISEEQWNQFQAEGQRFITAHNAAVDAFQLWSQTKSQSDSARVQAMLQILPQLIQEINSLVASFQEGSKTPASFPEAGQQLLAPVSVPGRFSWH